MKGPLQEEGLSFAVLLHGHKQKWRKKNPHQNASQNISALLSALPRALMILPQYLWDMGISWEIMLSV